MKSSSSSAAPSASSTSLSSEEEKPSWSHPGNQPDVYVRCPYFPEHELRRSRLPYHLPKCQKHPRAPSLLVCPFNYLHRVREEDRKEHLETCEDRIVARLTDKNPPSFATTQKEMMGSTRSLSFRTLGLKTAQIMETHSGPSDAYFNSEPLEEEW